MPLRIKIGGFFFDVEYSEEMVNEKGEKIDGALNHSQARIRIDRTMSDQAQVHTMIHEALHEIAIQTGNGNLREDVIDSLSFGMYQLLRDNPQLVEMITK